MIWPEGADDLLAAASWQVLSTRPGEFVGPEDLPEAEDPRWLPASVPGTAAHAVRAAQATPAAGGAPGVNCDAYDWWFRCPIPRSHGDTGVLDLGGLATLADVWLGNRLILHSENMFRAYAVAVPSAASDEWLAIRCAAPEEWLARRRPRPRWKCRDLVHPGYRWLRTSLLGRMTGGVDAPAPVGPWRPVTLHDANTPHVVNVHVDVTTDVDRRCGTVALTALIEGADPGEAWTVHIGEHVEHAASTREAHGIRLDVRVQLDSVELWWPATHGEQPLCAVDLVSAQVRIPLGRVGFRTIDVDRSDGGFTLVVNGVPIFARGATWTPPDPTLPHTPREELAQRLGQWREANLNLVRVTGLGVYESAEFAELCDELGILVWHDAMFAFYDIPTTPEFREEIRAEMAQFLSGWQGRPSLAVVCGASENEQQAEYLGLPPEQWRNVVTEQDIPSVVTSLVPGTVYVRTTPDGSPLPSQVDNGPSHYFGVGGYLRPLEDARRAGVRFAVECLPFATPPEPIEDFDRSSVLSGIGHSPRWKRAVHRDAAIGWDLEDARNWYTHHVLGVDLAEVRRYDSDRANDVARATGAAVFEATLSEWRRPGSSCHGVVVLQGHDTIFGAGLGLVDSERRPKSTWWVMRRLMQPVVVLFTDEGVNGLRLHVSNDSRGQFTGTVRLDMVADRRHVFETATQPVDVEAGSGITLDTGLFFGGFRDLSWAHRFGPPAFDAVVATLSDGDAQIVSRAHFLPRPTVVRDPVQDLGMRASLEQALGSWLLHVTTDEFAQWVAVQADGWLISDSWFHLTPGETRSLRLTPQDPARPGGAPRVTVRALNSLARVRACVEDTV